MAEPLRFQTSDGKEYVLEFNRRTVREAEQAGFDIDELSAKPMTRIPELFYFAFKMHHAFINKKETDRILTEEFGGLKEEELVRLAELYSEPYGTLVFNEEDGEEKNVRRVTIL